MKVLSVFGTRPEAIKMAPLVRSLREHSGDFVSRVVVSAQHRHMLDQVMRLFEITSDYDLNIMQSNQTLEHIVNSVLGRLGPILDSEKPDMVLVHGDTTTTFAASLSAFYHRIPVGHVEAGLRSYDKANPFPEESNRVLADHLCTLHFAPTHRAGENLLKENIPAGGIFVTGNTVIDALKFAVKRNHAWTHNSLKELSLADSRVILVTAHRRENLGEVMAGIFRALRRVAEKHPDVKIVYPVHLNPRVQNVAKEVLGNHPRIHLIPPVDYLDLINLMKLSYLVVTDSGGIQEEAPALGKPVLVLRKVTERPEAVSAGTARVAGVEEQKVFEEIDRLLVDQPEYEHMANAVNPYGDGGASARILDALKYHSGVSKKPPEEFEGDRFPAAHKQ
jgi:UDP-N-acetylglucosamine 2-epimerase (non-hydrolysing)